MALSDAQQEATARYNKKAYDRIQLRVRKGRKAEIVAYAKRKNKSVNQFITELIFREMEQNEAEG